MLTRDQWRPGGAVVVRAQQQKYSSNEWQKQPVQMASTSANHGHAFPKGCTGFGSWLAGWALLWPPDHATPTGMHNLSAVSARLRVTLTQLTTSVLQAIVMSHLYVTGECVSRLEHASKLG